MFLLLFLGFFFVFVLILYLYLFLFFLRFVLGMLIIFCSLFFLFFFAAFVLLFFIPICVPLLLIKPLDIICWFLLLAVLGRGLSISSICFFLLIKLVTFALFFVFVRFLSLYLFDFLVLFVFCLFGGLALNPRFFKQILWFETLAWILMSQLFYQF